jgi:hypothetical protein
MLIEHGFAGRWRAGADRDEVCPAGLWMAAPREVKCYCRILHMFTWKTTEPTELTHSDGLAIAMEKEE